MRSDDPEDLFLTVSATWLRERDPDSREQRASLRLHLRHDQNWRSERGHLLLLHTLLWKISCSPDSSRKKEVLSSLHVT